jgi:hypothetical protein
LSTSQSFVIQLCELLGVEAPHPTLDQSYMFERPITFQHGDGSTSAGRVDCYRRGHFVWESKKLKAGVQAQQTGTTTKAFDDALLRARTQAENYARALPASEGRPPFVVVVDVGHVIELYAEFTRSGATYTPFPDARSHRIRLDDLHRPEVRERLRSLWLDPMSLDPSRVSAKVTREVAVQLATVARSLEAAGHAPQLVAAFLTRCLFSMFAEDVELLPRAASGDGAFVDLLKRYGDQPDTLQRMLRALWTDMDRGGFSAALAQDVLRFNGKLFKSSASDGYVLPLNREQIAGLIAAADADWREVEPAIFGTLLERALDPAERHALGAHYTPRAYVERLVLPTVVEPLRADWANAQAAALLLATEANTLEGKKRDDKMAEARAEIKRFHHQLCTVRVLDPACGSGNFLYVTLEHLKRLEGEVLDQLHALGESQSRLGLEGETVTLQKLRGIELNERAAALAELVLWIGFLQWHIRTFGNASVAEPVVHDYGNIEHRDAVLAYDSVVPMRDPAGAVVTRWDGVSFKVHPVTGEHVPDEAAQVPQWTYVNPRQAVWPAADFIVGNPPFIGNKRMRDALGDGYVQALRSVWTDMPESADFVMYWWQRAADCVRYGLSRRFGLITTNSLTQTFNRRVVERALAEVGAGGGAGQAGALMLPNAQKSGADLPRPAAGKLSLVFAIPDHPWVDSAQGAAVRIAMTVGEIDEVSGRLLTVLSHTAKPDGEVAVAFEQRLGSIESNLTIGVRLSNAARLRANAGLSFMGMIPLDAGFWIDRSTADALGLGTVPGIEKHVRRYRNGRDLTARPRDLLALDFYGLTEDQLRERFPKAFQWLYERVKPTRQQDKRATDRQNWWIFAEARATFRSGVSGLRRFIGTTETAKHRTFVFIEGDVLPDQKIRVVVHDDAQVLGVLSSAVHLKWTDATGSTLEDRPVYNNTRCFEPFPFPSDDTGLTRELADRIRQLAEQLDAHRKARQAAHEGVTLTGMYNVLDKLRSGEALTAKDKLIHEQGLVSVLRTLHDDLDTAVLDAYGWGDLRVALADHTPAAAEARVAAVETLLERLVALNAKRAAEEAAGTVRWLRPEFQLRQRGGEQASIETGDEEAEAVSATAPVAAVAVAAVAKRPWPAGLPEQIKAVADVLTHTPAAQGLADLEARFTARGRWRERLPVILDTLEALGRARHDDAGWRAA